MTEADVEFEEERCARCGKCCRQFGMKLVGEHPSIMDARNCIIGNFKAIAGIEVEPIEEISFGLKGRCVHLKEDNTCGNYELRPQLCRDFFCKP